jgi:hypothetical protein
MTVKELIKILSTKNQEMSVVIDDSENMGVRKLTIDRIREISIREKNSFERDITCYLDLVEDRNDGTEAALLITNYDK